MNEITPPGFVDLTFSFPTANTAQAVSALSALWADALLADNTPIGNELGTPMDARGNPAVIDATGNSNMVFRGMPGGASYVDPVSGQTMTTDPASTYVAFRVTDAQWTAVQDAGINPTAYGLTVTSAAESAAVLGVWA